MTFTRVEAGGTPHPLAPTIAGLSPADVGIAELKALVGAGVTKTAFFELVRSIGPPSPDHKAWTSQKVGECVQRLTAKGVLGADGCPSSEWSDALLRRVVLAPDGARLAARVRALAPRSWRESSAYLSYRGRAQPPYFDVDLARTARLSALAGDEAAVETVIEAAEREALQDGRQIAMAPKLLAGVPLDPAVIAGLAPRARDRVMSAAVEQVLDGCDPPHGFEAAVGDWSAADVDWASLPRLDLALMRLDLLGERPRAARARIARLKSTAPILALAGEAALAFLEGPEGSGPPLFREALKQHRKALGKRKMALPAEFAVYHLMALFAVNDPALNPEISGLLDAIEASHPVACAALGALHDLVLGKDVDAKAKAGRLSGLDLSRLPPEPPLALAVTTLALAIVESGNAARRAALDWRSAASWGDQARLATRILAEVHGRLGRTGPATEVLARLDAVGPGYPRRFLDIVPIRAPWERTLEALQSFLAPPDATPKPAPVAGASRRLVFRLDAVTQEITAIEQAAKGAAWSPGRPVALKRLHQRDPKLDYLTPEDQRVVATIRHNKTYYDDIYFIDPPRGLPALVGHPRLYDAQAPDRRIELVRYPVELVVRGARGGIHIDLSHRAEEPAVFVEPETPTRWRLIEVTPALIELGRVLGPEGLEAPREARDRVVALIRTENPRMPVRSELAGVTAEAVKGDPRPVFQIAPTPDGFHVRAAVRPLGDAAPAYGPGQGSRSVLVADGGGHRRVDRDLAAEAAALETVVDACPALEPWRDSDLDWRIEGLDSALEALQQLRERPEPPRLEWPQGAALTPTRSVDAKAMSVNISSAKDWFEVSGKIAVDEDLVLDMAEILSRLDRRPGRFVALDDGRYLALTEDLRRRLDALAAITETSKGGRRIGAVGAAALEDLVEGAGSVKADRRWTELVNRMAAAQGHDPEVPAGLRAELRDYQRQGFTWLARLSRLGLGACLADDMGLGKTVQTLALLLSEAAKGASLVVAPTSVCHNWVLEATKFAPSLRVRTLAGAPDRAGLVASMGPGDVLVASYGLLHTEADLLAGHRFAVAVFDEAQNLKNAETRRAQASKRIDAAFRLALSGTPLENRLDELWSLFDTVTPGLLGSRESFQRRFSGPIERGHGAQARQALRTLLRPFLLRRTKAAVLSELPSRTEITLEVEPGPEEWAFYEALRRQAVDNLTAVEDVGGKGAGGQKRIRILAEITRLRRAACNPRLIEPDADLGSAKLAALLDLTDELRAGRHRALVFSQFTGHLDLVEAALRERGIHPLRVDGSTPARERARLVEAFQAGEGDLFLISLRAGGSGLNLTGADYVIHLDPWWNPAVEDQATDRAHRIGQTRPVTVYRLVTKGSIEESILSLHAAKRTLSADFLEDADAAGPLGEEELMALIRG